MKSAGDAARNLLSLYGINHIGLECNIESLILEFQRRMVPSEDDISKIIHLHSGLESRVHFRNGIEGLSKAIIEYLKGRVK